MSWTLGVGDIGFRLSQGDLGLRSDLDEPLRSARMCFCWLARVSTATWTSPFAARAWKYAVRTL